jgi:DNA invertase Pin-like site-specific DNA recombinase
MSMSPLNVMGAFAEFERAPLRERERGGMELAKSRVVYEGRKPSVTVDQAVNLRKRVAAGE